MTISTWMIRRMFKKGDDARDAGLSTPAQIERFDDILYGVDRKWQVLDVYRPRDSEGPLPVIVSVHGGGWAYGDKERYQFYCMDLACRGFAVVNFTYRLAPEFKFPAGIEDTSLVFSWLAKPENAKTYGFDLSRVCAVGDSAGAHMLALYSVIGTKPDFAALFPFQVPAGTDGKAFVPKALGLNCGIYDFDLDKADFFTKDLLRALVKGGRIRDEMPRLNASSQISADFPPCFVMTANKDPLAGPPAQAKLVQALKGNGILFVDKTYGTEEAPLNHVFHLVIRSEEAKRFNDEECEWFKSVMA